MGAGDRESILSRRARFIAASLATAGLATVVHVAESPTQVAEAQQPPPQPQPHVCLSVARPNPTRQAEIAFSRGDFPRALELFRQVYAQDPRPPLLVRIAETCAKLGDFVGARDAYLTLMRTFEDDASPPEIDRAEVEAKLREVEAKLGTVTLMATEPPSSVTIDDKPMPLKALGVPYFVNPGQHLVVIAHAYGTIHRAIVVESGANVEIHDEIVPAVCLSVPPHPPPRSGCGCDVVGRKT